MEKTAATITATNIRNREQAVVAQNMAWHTSTNGENSLSCLRASHG